MRFPGEVWFLPPDAAEGGDGKRRRHVLLTRCEERDGYGTFAFASTSSTEVAFGAAGFFLDPQLTRHGRAGLTGFDRPTWIYPSRLVGAGGDEIVRKAGQLAHELAEVRVMLHRALGIGTGASTGLAQSTSSWRGRIVRFTEPVRHEMECAYGLVITEHHYSRRERYQLVVPILDLREFESAELDVVVDGKTWLPLLFGDAHPAALAVEMVQTVYHPADVEGEAAVVDDDTLLRIDELLVRLFGL